MELPFLSVRADTNSRQRGRSVRCRKGKGSDLYPSASSAACDDDWLDKDYSVLHVQVYLARRDIYHLLSGSYSNRGRWGSDYTIFPVRVDGSDMSAFQISLNTCLCDT